jgi:putative oxidoreductase
MDQISPLPRVPTWIERTLTRPLELAAAAIHAAQMLFWPALDIIIRLWLAQIFFVSGVLKAANWDNALNLAANEYPVSWLDPTAAAWIGVAIELGGSILLAFGLGTRAAAMAMLILSLVIQFNYLAFDTQLFWAALFGFYVLRGAGPISLDNILARGLSDSALPLAATIIRAAGTLSRWFASPYLLCFRLWLAVAMLVAAEGAFSGAMPATFAGVWLPFKTAAHVPVVLLVPGAMLLAVGLGTRLTALVLAAGLIGAQMSELRLSEDWYWMLAMTLLAFVGPGRWSVDALIKAILERTFPQLAGKPAFSLEGLPRVVIVGAGFGGLACAAQLAKARVRVTLIDRHNYHLFQPLLYQVATAGLSPGDIATPIRGLFRERFNTEVLFGEVTGVDPQRCEVSVGGGRLPYD